MVALKSELQASPDLDSKQKLLPAFKSTVQQKAQPRKQYMPELATLMPKTTRKIFGLEASPAASVHMTYDYKTASVGQSCHSTKLNTDVPGASSDNKVHRYYD